MANESGETRRSFDPNSFSQQADVLNVVLDHLTQGMAVIGSDYRVLAFNRHFEELFQLPTGTVEVGVDFRDVLKVWAEVTGQDQQMLGRAILQLDESTPFEFEFPQQIKGEPSWCLLTHDPLPGHGFVRTFTDITKRKKAEEALRLSEQTYIGILDSISEAVYIQDESGIFLTVNLAAEKLYGYSKAEFVGRTPEFLSAPGKNDLSKLGEYIGKAFNGEPQSFEFWGLRKDGTTFPKEVSNTLGSYFGKKVNIAVARDITERKQAEDDLRESRTKAMELSSLLHAVLESPRSVVVFALDANYCYTTFTLAHAEVMRAIWGVEIVPGMNMLEVIQDPADVEKAKRNFDRVLAGEELALEEEYGNPPNRATYENRYSPMVDEAGTVSGLTVFCIDITQRKQLEQALLESEISFREVIENSPLAMLVSEGPEEKVRFLNRKFEELFGYSADDIKSLADWWPRAYPDAAYREQVQKEWAELGPKALAERSPFPPQDVTVTCKDGSTRFIRIELSSRGEAHTVTFTDLTQIRRAEEEKAKLQIQLQQSQKMESLGTLAGGVAHDMNNVLGAILGLSSAHLELQAVETPAYRAFTTIFKAATRGGALVKSLLTFARQTPAEDKELDLNTILQEEATLLERTTLSKVRLVLDLENDLRPIRGDESALTHAFMNLCVNAVDAMPENGTLTLRTRNVDHDCIEVVVEDTGTGMPTEVMEKALDPFFTTKGIGKGTGLGLSMVFSTVTAHRGQMEIQSEVGRGTNIRLRFPACMPGCEATWPAAELGVAPSRGTLKVLLVDDDELLGSSIQVPLELLGHTTTMACSGEEALTHLEAGLQPDVVMLDINMPGLGGAGTLPRLRALCPTVPVILITGRPDQTALELAGAHPHVALLSKPFGLKELQEQLKALGRELGPIPFT